MVVQGRKDASVVVVVERPVVSHAVIAGVADLGAAAQPTERRVLAMTTGAGLAGLDRIKKKKSFHCF